MTREQSLRGPDAFLPWVLFATAYDRAALERVATAAIVAGAFAENGAAAAPAMGLYALHCFATAEEVARTLPPRA